MVVLEFKPPKIGPPAPSLPQTVHEVDVRNEIYARDPGETHPCRDDIRDKP